MSQGTQVRSPGPSAAKSIRVLACAVGLLAGCGAYHDPGVGNQDVAPFGTSGAGGAGTPGLGPFGQTGVVGSAGRAGVSSPPVAPPQTRPGTATSPPVAGRPQGVPMVADASIPPKLIPDAGMPVPQWQRLTCVGATPQLLPNVKLTRPLDYAAIYQAYPASPGSDADAGAGSPAYVSLVSENGQACRTAQNAGTCNATISLLRVPGTACVNNGVCGPFLLTTVGDEVTRSEARSTLVALLGTINTPEAAALVAIFSGLQINCNTLTRVSATGYEVRSEWDVCLDHHYLETIQVAKDGSISGVQIQTSTSSCSL